MGRVRDKRVGTSLLTGDNVFDGAFYAASSGVQAAGSVLQGYGALKAARTSAGDKLATAAQMRIEAAEERRAEEMAADAALGAANAQIAANGIVGGSPEESVLDSWDRAFGAAALAYETRLNETRALQRQARADLKAGKNTLAGSLLGALGMAAGGYGNYLQATNKRGNKPFVSSALVPTNPKLITQYPTGSATGQKVPVKSKKS